MIKLDLTMKVKKKYQINFSVFSAAIFLTTLLCSLNTVQLSFAQEVGDNSDTWVRGIDMPTPRTEVTAANIGDSIYVLGGFTSDSEITDIVEMFNVTSNSWNKDIDPLPIPLYHAVAHFIMLLQILIKTKFL